MSKATSSCGTIRDQLAVSLNDRLVDELLTAYNEAKRNHYLGGHRLSAVEGGRFCEAAYRILQDKTTGSFTPLGRSLNANKVAQQLAGLPVGSFSDSIRLHIPRALRVIYDVRSNRDAAHLADGIDPNIQDSNLVVGILDWTLAEFVRIYHGISPAEAHELIAGLVTRSAPVIEDFDGFLKVLNPRLHAGDHCLVLLYQRDRVGATYDELKKWARPPMRGQLRRTLHRLVHALALVHCDKEGYRITIAGKRQVEKRHLLAQVQPSSTH